MSDGAKKVGLSMPVSTGMLEWQDTFRVALWDAIERDAAMKPREREVAMAKRREERRLEMKAVHQRHESALIAAASPLAHAILTLHKPETDYGMATCGECSYGAEESAPWPCPTYTLVKEWQE